MTFGLSAIQPTAWGAACVAAPSGWAPAGQRGRRQMGEPLQAIAQPMSRYFSCSIALTAALTALPLSAQETILLPSGGSARLHEVIESRDGDIRRRYVSDGFNPEGIDSEVLLGDMAFLCESSDLGQGSADSAGRLVVISLADRAAPFGVIDTTVRQVFEAFSIVGDSCIWEAF